MKKRLIQYTCFLMILLSACNHTQKANQENRISKIILATGGCYGDCPYSAIEIDSSLNYKYYGGEHSKKKGFFNGKISQGFWDTLNIKFEKINYQLLDSSYMLSVDDLSIEAIIYDNKLRKHIFAQSASLPDSVFTVFNWVLNSSEKVELIQESDSIKLETKIQFLKAPPPLKYKIKFTPPET